MDEAISRAPDQERSGDYWDNEHLRRLEAEDIHSAVLALFVDDIRDLSYSLQPGTVDVCLELLRELFDMTCKDLGARDRATDSPWDDLMKNHSEERDDDRNVDPLQWLK